MSRQVSVQSSARYPAAAVFKALGDQSRLAITLLVARHQELCVCELTAALAVSQPSISRQLGQLRELRLLEDERRGQWVYYRLHPALPGWILSMLNDADKANPTLLAAHEERLGKMADRPDNGICA